MSCQSVAAARPFTEHSEGAHFHRSVRFNSECRGSTREKHDIDKKDISGSIALSAMSGSHQMSQSAPSASHTFDLPETVPPAAACRFPKLEECAHFHYERVSLGGLSIETIPLPCEEMGPDWSPNDGWVSLRVRSHINSGGDAEPPPSAAGRWGEGSDVSEWTLTRNKDNFLTLDQMLHRCIYDRKVSNLPNLTEEGARVTGASEQWKRLVADYVHHLSIIADDSINCGPVLNWLQMDNKGHKLLVAGEDWQSINTPAVACAYSVRPYVSRARDEISFQVGDMISVIDMPGPNESLWWRGKRGFRVGFFPHHCVAVIGDKVPRGMTQPPPIVGSVAVAPIKPVLRKHGKLISLFRSFILSRPSRRSLKQQGILKERVFGCDLGEHLLNCGHTIPLVLVACAAAIEARGAVDGIYRLSGGSGLTQRLRAAFDAGGMPDLAAPAVISDPHAVASLLKMYFRELPNPLCTYQLYEAFVGAVAPHNPDGPNPTDSAGAPDEASRLKAVRRAVAKLPPPHYRTLSYLMRHLRRVSLLGRETGMTARNMAIVWAPNLLRAPRPHHALHGVAVQLLRHLRRVSLLGRETGMTARNMAIVWAPNLLRAPRPHHALHGVAVQLSRHLRRVSLLGRETGMTARNMAIVWAPNLLRAPRPHHALHGVAVQAVVTEFLICYAEELFADGQDEDIETTLDRERTPSLHEEEHRYEPVGLGRDDSTRRPKSLPLHAPTKLLSLEEARRRGGRSPRVEAMSPPLPPLPPPSGAIAAAAAQLRPQGDIKPKYIEVGSGPNNLPQYHTVLELPGAGSRRSRALSSGGVWVWRGLFSLRKPRPRPHPAPAPRPRPTVGLPLIPTQDTDVAMCGVRPVKSCESLASDSDTLAPLALTADAAPLKQHTRSASCDSYFEPWQLELADMRLRLAPQERDNHMFSEEDDTNVRANKDAAQEGSLCSTPAGSLGSNSGACSAEPSPRRPLRVDVIAANDRQRSMLEDQLPHIGYIDGDSPRHPAPPAHKRQCTAPPASRNHNEHGKRLCKDRDGSKSSGEFQSSPIGGVKMRERNSPRKSKSSRYSGLPLDTHNDNTRLSWHGDGHSTLIKIDWPLEHSSVSNLTNSTNTPITPNTPNYDPLESDSEASDNKRTIKINNCDNCHEEKCLKCELKATDYENVRFGESPVDISYHNLNRLSATSSDSDRKREESHDVMKIMTSSHESSSSYSKHSDDAYESYNFRPNYINLHSSSTSKSSPGSPLKSPLKSTISITFRSPTKMKKIDQEDTPTNDRDSIYEDVVLEKNLSIVEDASVPGNDASLPTPACQPNYNQDLIILETPTQTDEHEDIDQNVDVYSQVKFFKKSIDEVNAMIYESPEKERLYENVDFDREFSKIHGKEAIDNDEHQENGNVVKKNLNVRELAIRFESPTEPKGPFVFEKFKAEIKYPSLERKDEDKMINSTKEKPTSPNSKLSRNNTARSLDENAFVKEFGDKCIDRRKSLEVRDPKSRKFLPDLNLNMTEEKESKEKLESITPTTENKISLIQRFEVKSDIKPFISHDTEKNLSRERIEKYKEERRNFLREKYSSQSFRSNPEQLTRIKIKKDHDKIESCERLKGSPKFERSNSVDLGQRMRFSLTKSDDSLDTVNSSKECSRRAEGEETDRNSRDFETQEKVSPSYNIRDMAAMFEQKSHHGG